MAPVEIGSRFTGMCRICAARGLAVCMLFGISSVAARAQAPPATMAQLRAGFQTPPPAARLRCYWWWLNGNTDKATITNDLEQMAAKGFGGVLLVDANGSEQEGNHNVPAGPMFGSPAWVELYTHALREADRLGLEITLNITSGWNLGGPGVPPEQSSKLLTWTRTPVHGGTQGPVQLAAPAAKNGFYRQIAVLAYPLHQGTALRPLPGLRDRSAAVETGFSMPESDWMLSPTGRPGGGSGLRRPTANDMHYTRPVDDSNSAAGIAADASRAEVVNVTANVSADGSLTWNAPPGEWEVLRIGYTDSDARVSTSSDTWKGRAIDYLSKEAFDAYWEHTVVPLLQAAKPFHSLKNLATDSWELGGTNWTETFAAEFRKRRGYDPVPWLAAVTGRVIESPDATARFLTDMRRTVADLIVDNHYNHFAARAAEYGLGIESESGGPHGAPIDALETFARSAVPQTEFWAINPHRNNDLQRFFVKQAASAANIYGQRLVAGEGETSINEQWTESLAADLKPTFDMGVTEGLNRLVWHEFTSSPASTGLPGQEYFAGTHVNPKVTWWNAAGPFFTYLNRVQFMMQQGTAVNDVLYFYGDNVPSFVRLKADDPAHALPGYDYDVTDEDALLRTLYVERGRLTGPSGVQWRALMMPISGRLSLAALERIAQLAGQGITVIGNAPVSATGQQDAGMQARFRSLVVTVWGEHCPAGSHHRYQQGEVYCTVSAHQALASMEVKPDVELGATDGSGEGATFTSNFDYVHRRVGAAEVYFVRNGSARPAEHDVTFRAQGARVELWNAVSGAVTALPGQALEDGRTRVHLQLAPFGSALVVFSPAGGPVAEGPTTAVRTEALPPAAWSVSFQAGRGAPQTAVTMSELKSWTESADPGVRYFSGTATYKATVSAPVLQRGSKVYLQFSDVREIAHVRINGHDAGTVWAKPLQVRVDPWLRDGANEVEIEVTNLWPNRIIGDLQPGATVHITNTNIATYRADSPLLPSGLIGPLMWRIEH